MGPYRTPAPPEEQPFKREMLRYKLEGMEAVCQAALRAGWDMSKLDDIVTWIEEEEQQQIPIGALMRLTAAAIEGCGDPGEVKERVVNAWERLAALHTEVLEHYEERPDRSRPTASIPTSTRSSRSAASSGAYRSAP